MLKDEYPSQVAEAIDGMLPQWLEVMSAVLVQDASADLIGDWEGLKIRNEIFRVSMRGARDPSRPDDR
jgi:hypothetical protein